MKVGVYPRYGRLGASSRLRFYDYFDYLSQHGFQIASHPGLSDRYLTELYRTGRKSKIEAVRFLARRFLQCCHLEKNLWIEYELLPGVSGAAEERFLRGRRYVLGFDDYVARRYEGTRLQDKYARLLAGAGCVICANRFLSEWARQYQDNVVEIPTAVDLRRYRRERLPKRRDFTAVWIGTPVTAKEHLLPRMETLRRAAREVDFTLLVVGAEVPRMPDLKIECVPWTLRDEVGIISQAQVGIMPLPEGDDFASGKSAYKLIQCQAAGLPVIASGVGENTRVVTHGVNGFIAGSDDDWIESLKTLVANRCLYETMARNAERRAEDYDTAVFAPRIAAALTDAFKD